MASRKADKEAARQRRLEQERAAQSAAQRKQRLTIAGSLLIIVIAVAVVLVIVLGGSSSSDPTNSSDAIHPQSKHAKTEAAKVESLLKGIPQHGNALGNPKAPVTFVEYGDLECSICQEFALGPQQQLIANEVRDGKVRLVYKSLETATSEQPNDPSNLFIEQQSAAYAAGPQSKAWNYIELFYHEQGSEGTPYVTTDYLTGLAKQVPGLDVPKWNNERFNPAYATQIQQEAQQIKNMGLQHSTPTLIAIGKHSQTKPVQGLITYGQVQSMIKSVSS